MKRFFPVLFPAMLLCALAGCRTETTVSLMTYNVGTFTKFEENSLRMIADMVKETGADVVSMNELDSWSAVLPQGDGAEPRALVVMEFDSYVVASTHLDHVSPEAQLGQVRAITGMLEARYSGGRKPVFLCGDMNAVPGSDTMKEFELHWDVISPEENTFPSDAPDCCIDYILAMKGTGKFEVVRSAVLRDFASGDTAAASDHLPVYAEVKVAR